MNRKRMLFLFLFLGFGVAAYAGSQLFSRSAYESAEYRVIEKDGEFELREYPELTMAATKTQQGRNGSFMRLFGYISGENENQQKIAMTTPVFMEMDDQLREQKMSFVLPKQFSVDAAPVPAGERVTISTRPAGRYAVIRFSGRLNQKSMQQAEIKLRKWIVVKGWQPTDFLESAGYDPPMTPPPLRRNEILIKLQDEQGQSSPQP